MHCEQLAAKDLAVPSRRIVQTTHDTEGASGIRATLVNLSGGGNLPKYREVSLDTIPNLRILSTKIKLDLFLNWRLYDL